MSALELCREWLLLGAQCAVLQPEDQVPEPKAGFVALQERWAELGQHLVSCEEDEPLFQELSERLGGPEAAWLCLLCAAVELFPEAAAAQSLVAEDERMQLVTAAGFARLWASVREGGFDDALAAALPEGPLDEAGLVERVEAVPGRPSAQAGIRLRPEALRALGQGRIPSVATGSFSRHPPPSRTAFPRPLVEGVAGLVAEHGLVCLRSGSARAARQLAFDLSCVMGQPLHLHSAGAELPRPESLPRAGEGLWAVDVFAASQQGFPHAFVRGLAGRAQPTVVLCPWNAEVGEWPTVEVEPLDLAARARVFAECLPADDAEALARRFTVSVDEVRQAARGAAIAGRLSASPAPSRDALEVQLLEQGARRMGRMVTRLRSRARFGDLVVPARVQAQLEEIVAWRSASAVVQAEWGVGRASPLGKGLSCLFSGPPGTGKTFAAQCLANALGLNLYRIDLSQVVSKYIGETEKALAQVFDEAEAGHGVLLFDEADALFGKRSEVKDAHDRYANIEVGYLLQRLEAFDGVAVLTTNLRGNMDPAFIRRLRFVVDFPMPDAGMRGRIWEQCLPPREKWKPGLQLEAFVERFPLSGGNISNIGLAAAHLAAAADSLMDEAHLVRATFRELEKAGLARTKESFGPLAVHLPGGTP